MLIDTRHCGKDRIFDNGLVGSVLQFVDEEIKGFVVAPFAECGYGVGAGFEVAECGGLAKVLYGFVFFFIAEAPRIRRFLLW